MLISVAAILVYFILATYASTVYFGPGKMVNFAQLRQRRALGWAGPPASGASAG